MRSATVKEIKDELSALPHKELVALLQRLARFKKDNKELLTYLLFESTDLDGYLTAIRQEMLEGMLDIRPWQSWLAKKTIRKTLRIAMKHIRLSSSRQAEADLLLHFIRLVLDSGIDLSTNLVVLNLCHVQARKARAAIEALHEDLQFEYRLACEQLELSLPDAPRRER
ncbi:MAG: hypothetical protein FJX89_00190 [Bacteroidetes bacterium]|nr:hypothetical protein [Bacteroidota bacterium]